jgi:hypothetical protein
MAKVKTEFNCFCDHKQDVTYKKPTRFQASCVSVTCKVCDSEYFVKYKLKSQNQVTFEVKLTKLSETLRQIGLRREMMAKANQQPQREHLFNESMRLKHGEQQDGHQERTS